MPPSSDAVSQLRLDILWMSQRWLLGFGVVLRVFFCGVLAHIAALCIRVFMPLQRSDAFVEADESGADTWIQGPFWWHFLSTSRGTPSPRLYSGMGLHGVAIGLPTVTRFSQVAGTPSKKKSA